MDEETAKSLLAKLLSSVQAGSNTSLTQEMIDALQLTAQIAFGDDAAKGSSGTPPRIGNSRTETPTVASEEHKIELKYVIGEVRSKSLELENPEDPDITLCLDFGTAMSKAFAIKSEHGGVRPIDLPLGKVAGEPAAVYPVSSSLWISDDGLIFFGHEAIRRSLLHGKRGRLDSLKQYLSQGDVPYLTHLLLEEDRNPSRVKLSIEDVLTLYLGYLTDIACTALEVQGVGRYVRRRFALPPWAPGRRADCEKLLRGLLARAQVIADHLHGRWGSGIPADEAKALVDYVHTVPKLPLYLMDRGVSEPLAAAQGRLGFDDEDELLRGLVAVIDVGAGTSDLGLFHVNRVPGTEHEMIATPISQRNLKQAGDFVDECLRKFILKQSGVSENAPDFKLINDDLALRIRRLKERLFVNATLVDTLSNSTQFNINLNQFVAEPEVQRFSARLCEEFDALLNDAETFDWIRARAAAGLLIVFTGGGADLPMVQSLSAYRCQPHAIALENRAAPRTSHFIEESYPALVPEYPQLAVATGGAHPQLAKEGAGGRPSSELTVEIKRPFTG
jgi:molecular chaperone HscA